VFATAFFILDKLDYIAAFVTPKAVVGVGFGVNFATGFIVGVEGAEDLVVAVGLDIVMGKYRKN